MTTRSALSTLLTALLAALAPAAPPAYAAPSPSSPTTTAPAQVRIDKVIGHSARGRAIHAYYRGTPGARHVLVLLGQMHGDEPAGRRTAEFVRDRMVPRERTGVWIVVSMNPDGAARGTRANARRVDLNRNWPTSGWTSAGRGGRYWGGPRPASEPETRAMIRFLRQIKPDYIASIHQPLAAIGSMVRTASTPAATVFLVPPVSWMVKVRKVSLSSMP